MNAVQFGRSMPVTNASCCSHSRVMCERCATAALNAAPSLAKAPPTMTEAEWRRAAAGIEVLAANARAEEAALDSEDLDMVPPVINWEEEQRVRLAKDRDRWPSRGDRQREELTLNCPPSDLETVGGGECVRLPPSPAATWTAQEEADDVKQMVPPVINWEEEAKNRRRS